SARGKTIYVLSAILLLVLAGASAARLAAYRQPLGLWDEVVRRQPDNEIARQQIAKYLDDAGDSAAALAHLREAVRVKPDSFKARLNLGMLLLKTKAYNEAAEQFAEAVRLEPSDVRTLTSLAASLSL